MTRNDAGPFLVLGIDKDADDACVTAQFEARLELARRHEINWTEADLIWARDQLLTQDLRTIADAESWNVDLASGDVRRLARLYRVDSDIPSWEPIDPEPPAELPEAKIDVSTLIAELPAPTLPLDFPAVDRWLDQYANIGIDPWSTEIFGN